MEWIWQPFHVGLKHQPLHNGFIWRQAVTKDFRRLFKCEQTSVVVMSSWWIHIPIHSIWRLSNTFHMYGVDMAAIKWGFEAPTTAQWLHLAPSSDPVFQTALSNSEPTSVVVMAWWWIHIPIHGIWRLSNTFHMYGVDVAAISCGFEASTTAQWLHLAPSSDQGFQTAIYMWTDKCGENIIMVDPYSHPQHMKVVKHLSYVWSGYGSH